MNTQKKIELLDFKLSKSLWNSLFWAYKSKFFGKWIDFEEHKEYDFWDPVKNIDWKASSKSDKFYSKIFEEERDLKVLFLIDINPSFNFSFEKRTKKDVLEELFYAISFSAYNNWDSIWAMMYSWENDEFFEFKKSVSNIFNVIKKLENLDFSWKIDEKRTEKVLEKLKNKKIKNTLIFILTDNISQISDKLLKIISLENEIIFINIFDYFENNLEKLDKDMTFKFEKNFLNISLRDKKKMKEYSNLREEKLKNFEYYLKKNNIKNLVLDTKEDVLKKLYLFFSK